MNTLIAQFQEYVAEVTGVRVDVHTPGESGLPQHLAQRYALYQLRVGDRRFLGILLREPEQFQPARFEKQLARLKEADAGTDGYCVVAPALTSYVRQRLVERRIPFVVPGRQVSWPALGIIMEARLGHGRLPEARDQVMPATQMVILLGLNGMMHSPLTPKALTERLGYTAMTMSRALDEIEAHGLGRVTRVGRERRLDFPEGRRTLWAKAEGLLRNPVRKNVRLWIRDMPFKGGWWAGESALAQVSQLTEPREPVLAVGRDVWKSRAERVEEVPIPEPDTGLVQVWRYDPARLAREGRVDPFSLYLSLRDEPDERVQIALEEMMEKVAWSEA